MGVSTRSDVDESRTGTIEKDCRVFFEREIPSDEAFVRPLTFRAVEFLIRESLLEEVLRERMQLCVTEALRNAIHHGNKCDFTRSVWFRIFVSGKSWGFLIEDEGGGFDPDAVPDPMAEDAVWGESGRGVSIMRHYMDSVEYRSGGSALIMVKKRGTERE